MDTLNVHVRAGEATALDAELRPARLTECPIYWQATVSGTVRDAATGTPLVGATVQVVGTPTGATTDLDGSYAFRLDDGSYAFRVSYAGYVPLDTVLTVSTTWWESHEVRFDAVLGEAPPLPRPVDDWGYIPILDRSPMASRDVLGDQIRHLPIGR